MKVKSKKRPDPYVILGVEPSASEADITRAFRRRAMDTHPDRGGDRAEFEAVTRANVVLSDPAKRAKFDSTGEMDDDAVDVTDQAALNIIGQVIAQAIGGDVDPCKADFVGSLKTHFGKVIGEIDARTSSLKKAKARAEKMRGRFSRKGEGDNLLERMMGWQIDNMDEALRGMERTRSHHQRAIEILGDYDFRSDPPEHAMFYNNTFSAASSTPTGW